MQKISRKKKSITNVPILRATHFAAPAAPMTKLGTFADGKGQV